jgi:hypothetical protein
MCGRLIVHGWMAPANPTGKSPMRRGWFGRLVFVAILFLAALWVGVHFELIRVTTDGIRIMHEEDLSDEQLIRRADLYFRIFQYDDALRIYCGALFKEKPGHIVPLHEYDKPAEGELDLANIDRYEDIPKLPDTPRALFNIAVCHTKLSQPKEAMYVYKAFQILFPDSPLMPLVERNMEELRVSRM